MYPDLEPYEDYKFLYTKEVNNFLQGQLLYKDFYHAYPPLFLYLLSAFAFLQIASWIPALPLVIFDVLTIIPIYLISLRLVDKKKAFIVSLVWALSPVALWYNTILWLNPPPSTFFMLISTLLFMQRRYNLSSLSLAIATGFKQTSIVLFPIFLIMVLKDRALKKTVSFIATFSVMLLTISLPYIIWYPETYLWCIGFPGLPVPSGYAPPSPITQFDLTTPLSFATLSAALGFSEYVGPLQTMLWPILVSSFILIMYRIWKKRMIDQEDVIIYSLYAIMIFDILFPRGIYKYFYVTALPYLALFIRDFKRISLYYLFNIILLFIPRHITVFLTSIVFVLIPSLRYKISGFEDRIHNDG
jgi:hypothetical protein